MATVILKIYSFPLITFVTFLFCKVYFVFFLHIEQEEEKKQLEKQISALQAKIRKTKQFNRKVELNNELKKLKKMLEKF